MQQKEMPMGFAMALTENPEAMRKFATLSEVQKREIIEGTHAVKSKAEMHRYVDALVTDQR